jgi:hypothetical protein
MVDDGEEERQSRIRGRKRSGGTMKIIAFLTDHEVVDRITTT